MADDRAGDRDAAADMAAKIDTTAAHPARVYDYWLGGKDNFAADREAAERVPENGMSAHGGVGRKP